MCTVSLPLQSFCNMFSTLSFLNSASFGLNHFKATVDTALESHNEVSMSCLLQSCQIAFILKDSPLFQSVVASQNIKCIFLFPRDSPNSLHRVGGAGVIIAKRLVCESGSPLVSIFPLPSYWSLGKPHSLSFRSIIQIYGATTGTPCAGHRTSKGIL